MADSTSTSNSRVSAEAIAYLNAIEIAPGKYAYQDPRKIAWFVVKAETIERIGAESVLNALVGVRMPSDWKPH